MRRDALGYLLKSRCLIEPTVQYGTLAAVDCVQPEMQHLLRFCENLIPESEPSFFLCLPLPCGECGSEAHPDHRLFRLSTYNQVGTYIFIHAVNPEMLLDCRMVPDGRGKPFAKCNHNDKLVVEVNGRNMCVGHFPDHVPHGMATMLTHARLSDHPLNKY